MRSANGNIVCRQILLAKLRCKKPHFAENYRYLSWKYSISDCDWYTNITYIMGNVKLNKNYYTRYHTMPLFYIICVVCVPTISVKCLPKHN